MCQLYCVAAVSVWPNSFCFHKCLLMIFLFFRGGHKEQNAAVHQVVTDQIPNVTKKISSSCKIIAFYSGWCFYFNTDLVS